MPNDWQQVSQGLCIEGVNSAVRPDLIGQNQVAWMINGTVRDGKPRTRIGLKQVLILPNGKFQGTGFYSNSGGRLMFSIGGKLYRAFLVGNDFTYEEVTLGFDNAPNLDDAWMVETPSGFVVQDNQSSPIIYNGSVTRRAAIDEVPIGSAMAFGNGRLWVVTKGGRNLKAGNIYDGDIGSELLFTETEYLLGGGAFYYPFDLTGLGFLPVNNTASGYGSLMVFGSRNLISLRAEVTQRDLWQIIPGFQTIVLDGIGTPSHHSITRVDQDLYWRDEQGQIRSVRSAAQEAQGPGNTSLSREVSRIVNYETPAWLRLCSGVYVNNRLLFTAAPLINTPLPQNIVFQKLISLDCAPLASIRGKAPPAYDGEWTGAYILRVVQGTFRGEKRSFAVVQRGMQNSLWEFTDGLREDSYLDGGNPAKITPIESSVEFRRFDFGDPSAPKCLTRCDVYPSQIEGDVEVSVYWRVGNRNQWNLWGSFDACAEMTDPPQSGNSDNLLLSPNDFSVSLWDKNAVTVAGSQSDPDGGTAAQLVAETNDMVPSIHILGQGALSIPAGKPFKIEFDIKSFGSRTKFQFDIGQGDPTGGAEFIVDIGNESIEASGTGTVPATNLSASLTSLGGGWFRFTAFATWPVAAPSSFYTIRFLDATGQQFYIGADTDGFYFFQSSVSFYGGPHVWKNLRSQERGRVKSLTIPSLKDAIMQLAQSAGYTFQIRLVWTGDLTIDRIDVFARPLTDKAYSDVFDLPVGCKQNEVSDNELQYTIIPASFP